MNCGNCHKCTADLETVIPGTKIVLKGMVDRMILCPSCGNKRCPKASDHELECAGSNEAGQKGSVYQ
ncbi:hypothetical protein EAW52_10770 [Pseudomonas sp. LTJR-52]|nr:hypothetical protein EAW52_10770 [Pseudomonas sp. LTJR-52]